MESKLLKLFFGLGNMKSKQYKLKLVKFSNLIILLGFISRIFWSFSAQYREDEGLILWLALTKNFQEVIFSNVTSKGIPNPNLAIFFLKTLTPLDSLLLTSLVLSSLLGVVFYKTLKTSNSKFNLLLLISISLNSYLIFTSSSIALHLLTAVFNVLFLKIVFEYRFNKNYSYALYFPVITIIPFSIYLGGLVNTVIYFLSFVFLLILNLKKFKLNFSSKNLLFLNSFILISIIYVTWYRYFKFIDLETFNIQNKNDGGSFLPYSRLRDYVFVGFQYTMEFPKFYLEVFTSKETIYYPLNLDSKLDNINLLLSGYIFKFHKYFNLLSGILVISGCLLRITKFKSKVNKEFLNKSILTILFIFLYTVGSPLLGGRSFLDFDYVNLSVFSSIYILFVYLWLLSFFIFKLDILRKIFTVIVALYFSLNILLTVKTNIDYVNNTSSYLTESDESSFHKEKIVDFIARNVNTTESDVTVFYDLGGGHYNWTENFNIRYYNRDYYDASFTFGREIDYLLKSKHNLNNLVDQSSYKDISDSNFYIGYTFDIFPVDVYENFKHFYFGNYRVTINLNYFS